MNDARASRELILGADAFNRFMELSMAFLSAEPSVAELTLLLLAIVLALIPLTIWLLCDEDKRQTSGRRIGRGQKSVNARLE